MAPYLAGLLTIVMHASDVGDLRYSLVERAQATWLKDVQHVIVHGGKGQGSLQDPPNQSLPVADVKGGLSLVDAWNETWGRWSGNPSGVKGHRRRLRQQLLNNENQQQWQRKLLQWQKQRQQKLQSQQQFERQRQRRLFTVSYPDNPGCCWAVSQVKATAPEDKCYSRSADGPALGEATFMKIGKYVGAQRTTLGVYLANATWPNTEWTMVLDDDNWIVPSRFIDWVRKEGLDPDLPLLLGGRVGPGRFKIPCPMDNYDQNPFTTTTTYKTTSAANSSSLTNNSSSRSKSNATANNTRDSSSGSNSTSRDRNGTITEAVTTTLHRWGCCGNASRPCRAHLQNPQGSEASQGGAAVWAWNESQQSMAVKEQCTKMKAECCRSEPWPAGEAYRYPWRVTPSDDAPYQPHFVEMWPFGGEAYVLSRGLLNAIGRDYWAHCMSALQCANADHRVMTCVLNAGYSLTSIGKFPTLRHHARAPQSSDDKCWSSYSLTQAEEGPGTELKCVSKADHDAEVFTNVWAAAQPDEALLGNLGTPESQAREKESRQNAYLERVGREEARRAAREGKGAGAERLGPRARGQCSPDGRGSTFGGPGGPCGASGEANEPTNKRSRRKANDALKQKKEMDAAVTETQNQVIKPFSGESSTKNSEVGKKKIVEPDASSSSSSSGRSISGSSSGSGALESRGIREIEALLGKHHVKGGLPRQHVAHQNHESGTGGSESALGLSKYGEAGQQKLGGHHRDHHAPKFGLPS